MTSRQMTQRTLRRNGIIVKLKHSSRARGCILESGEADAPSAGVGALKKLVIEPLSNFDLEECGGLIPHFHVVLMRDGLPSSVRAEECGIVNLDSGTGGGTHWVAYHKNGGGAVYFDSYGLDPPQELSKYLGWLLRTHTFQLQGADDAICGHLCLLVLYGLAAGRKFEDIVLVLARLDHKPQCL
jgi:hypothetical protein